MHVILWEFQARRGQEAEFERAYGPEGVWAKFFRQGKGYLGTELWCDREQAGRYVAVDRWTTRDAYEKFRTACLDEYKAIDERCKRLTERETHLGTFARVQRGSASGAPRYWGIKK